MKTLRLSTLVLLLASVFYSCTKDDASLSVAAKKTEPEPIIQSDKKPVLTPIIYLTSDATKTPITTVQQGQQVTLAYAATDVESGADVTCGRITIHQWNGTEWVAIEGTTGPAPSVSYSFTATTAGDCAYKFRASFNPGQGNEANKCGGAYGGVGVDTQQDFCVKVTSNCVTAFTVEPNVAARDLENGTYEFTITYTLRSPEARDKIKFQGGATSGGQFKHTFTEDDLSGGLEVVHLNNQNTVLKYEGPIAKCEPLVLSFKYTRKFSCPEDANSAVTGKWTASWDGLEEPIEVAPLTYNCGLPSN